MFLRDLSGRWAKFGGSWTVGVLKIYAAYIQKDRGTKNATVMKRYMGISRNGGTPPTYHPFRTM